MSVTDGPRRAPLLPNGLFLLGLSLLLTVLVDTSGGGPAAVGWLQSAAFWVGLICIAGHVLRLALAPAASPQGPAESRDWYGS